MIEEKINQAEKGRELWSSLLGEQKKQDKILYLLFCGEDNTLENLAKAHLIPLIKQQNAQCAMILTCEASFVSQGDYMIVKKISHIERESLLAFYELYQFTDQLFILSLTRPFGSKLYQLLEKGFSKECILKECIFKLQE